MIIRNAARCRSCGQVVESRSIYDFRFCTCKKLGVDGGSEYLRRTWAGPVNGAPETLFDELSEFA